MQTAVKERPILFSGPMVRAILEGRKTQTRRIVKPQPEHGVMPCPYCPSGYGERNSSDPVKYGCRCTSGKKIKNRYGFPGDHLWVREAFSSWHHGCHWRECTIRGRSRVSCSNLFYRATHHYPDDDQKWIPSIHMPRWASRITLEITDVRVQRLQDISEEDAIAEGCQCAGVPASLTNRGAFAKLWESINGPGAWGKNYWVWAISFRRIEQ